MVKKCLILSLLVILLIPNSANALVVDNAQIDTVYSGLYTRVKWSDTTETTAQYNLKQCQPTQLTDCNPVAIRPVTSAGGNIMVPSHSYAQWTFYVRSGDYGAFSLMNLSNRWTLQIIDTEITKINDYQFESAEVGTGGTNMVRSYRNGWRVTLTLYNPADFADYVIVEPDNSVGIWYSINAYGNVYVYTDNVIVYHQDNSQSEVADKENQSFDDAQNAADNTNSDDYDLDVSESVGVIEGITSALGNVEATGCTFPDVTWGPITIPGGDVCFEPLPSWWNIVGTCITVGITLPLVWYTTKRVILFVTTVTGTTKGGND